jgi:threonine dehydrogenase-like Zn-dependent dehydrogenase
MWLWPSAPTRRSTRSPTVAMRGWPSGASRALPGRESSYPVGSRASRWRVLGGYWEVPTPFGQRGVDVAIEASGSIPALQHAIRATRFEGTICMISYYGEDAAGLRLGDEFHVNRQQLVSARVESLPLRDAPAWTLERLIEVALGWLTSGRLRTEGIVTPVVPFEESVEAYREIDEHPERSIKLGIRFS